MVQTVRQLILQARERLSEARIDDAAFNADCMAAEILGTDNGRLPLYWPEKADAAFVGRLADMVRRRCANEPLQYILQNWCFLDMTLTTRPGALIPRPETEDVFDAAVKAISAAGIPDDFLFADVGTGTGALGLALARRFARSRGVLIDISSAALSVARENLAKFHELHGRVNIACADLLSALVPCSLQVVISNPPYIDELAMSALMPEVRDYEPGLALGGGPGGLVVIGRLLSQAAEKLVAGGLLIFEHGHGQRRAIKGLIGDAWVTCRAGDDLAGRERYFILSRKTLP